MANYVEQRASAGRALSAADAARLAAAHRAKALLLASLRLRWRAAAHDPDAAAAGDLALGRLDMSEEAVAALTAPSLWVSCSEVGGGGGAIAAFREFAVVLTNRGADAIEGATLHLRVHPWHTAAAAADRASARSSNARSSIMSEAEGEGDAQELLAVRSLSGNVTLAVPAASTAEADGGGGGSGDELRLAWDEDAAAAPGWRGGSGVGGGAGGRRRRRRRGCSCCARGRLAAPDIDDEIASDELLWCGAADVAVPPLAPGESRATRFRSRRCAAAPLACARGASSANAPSPRQALLLCDT